MIPHWEHEVKDHDKIFISRFQVIPRNAVWHKIPGYFKWSLAICVQTMGRMYENMGRYVYVNRGFGFHAYPESRNHARNNRHRTRR
jgi:hypothetical protein